MANDERIEKTSCQLRVLIRFNDGTIGAYAIDGIPSASRLRDQLGVAADVFSDPQVAGDMLPEDRMPAVYREVFDQVQSALTVGAAALDESETAAGQAVLG